MGTFSNLKKNVKLDEVDYWKWRLTVEELHHAQTRGKFSELRYASMQKDIEIQRLKASAFLNIVTAERGQSLIVQKEYDSLKSELESKYKVSLKDCVINQNMEVVKLEEKKS